MRNKIVIRRTASQPDDPTVRHIALTQGKIAVVDAADYEELSKWNWFACLNPTSGHYYAKRNLFIDGKMTTLPMHTAIIGASPGRVPDHIDGDTLNNRRSNLRAATPTESCINRRIFKNNKTGFRGVSHAHHGGKFAAKIRINKILIHLGYFDTAEEASEVVIARQQQEFTAPRRAS